MKISAQHWIEYAKADLKNCEKILDEEFLTNIVAFHAQQVVEKCFKAMIDSKDLAIPTTHSIVRLNNMIGNYLVRPIEMNKLLTLENAYANSLYPIDNTLTEIIMPSLTDATEFYKVAKYVYDITIKSIGK